MDQTAAVPTDWVAAENRSTLSRLTCGWRLPGMPAEAVWRYWRDVHSPAIARRAGIHEYRHSPFGAVDPALFNSAPGIETACPADAQLQWQSDVRYRGDNALEAFGASPPPSLRAHILADIEMIVDKSTTYRVVGENARTLKDESGDPAPQGPVAHPTYGVFFRNRGPEAPFRDALRAMAAGWAARAEVRRVRLNLFDVPDMEAERKAGYPVKTHPQPQQYQAWVDLVVDSKDAARGLLPADLADTVAAVHAYPCPAVYTFNAGGRPTFVGLRGYCAYEAMRAMPGRQHADAGLLAWMYGPVSGEGPVA